MRVLQLAQKPQRRGAEVFAYQLSQELRRQGDSVQILYLYLHGAGSDLPVGSSDRLLNAREHHPYERLPGVQPSLLGRLLHTIDQYAPDIVQVNGSRTVKYGAFATLLRPRRSWALVYHNIGNPQDWVNTSLHYAYYRWLVMPRIDGVVGVSRTTLEHVRQFYRLSVPMIRIPHGVDPAMLTPVRARSEVRRQLDTPLTSPVVIYVGSLTPEKRPDRLLRLMATLMPTVPDLRVWLIGDGVQRSLMEQQAQTLGLAQSVRFLGVQTNVADYLQAADLFVLTSDTEGIPAVLQEAGYMGVPVVATKVGGVAECVVDGETGLLVEPQDEVALAEAVRTLLADPQRRAAMGGVAADLMRRTCLIDILAAEYRRFYAMVLAQRAQG